MPSIVLSTDCKQIKAGFPEVYRVAGVEWASMRKWKLKDAGGGKGPHTMGIYKHSKNLTF